MMLFRSKKNLKFYLPKKLNFFFPPCRVRSLLPSKLSIIEEKSTKKTDIVETKKKLLKIVVQVKKLRKKKRNISLVVARK